MVCTLIDNDTRHHSGQNVVDSRGAAELVSPQQILEKNEINLCLDNRPRSIYQYSNMAPRLSGETSIFGAIFFVSKSLLRIERQKKPPQQEKLDRTPPLRFSL